MFPVKRFVNFIEQNKLIEPGNKILAAVSGGMDSVLMAHLFKSAGFNFGIAHCNFMLREAESQAEQKFTRQLAQRLGISFHTVNFDTAQHAANHQISIQMAARELRYQWFSQICQTAGYEAVALAHHQNDTIETILLNLTRGTGIAGLHGILPKNGQLIRPMLFLTREKIQEIVKQEKLEYMEDSSNSSVKYARNKMRLQVVPLLKKLNPALEATFEENLRHFRDLEVLLNDKVAALKEELLTYAEKEVYIDKDAIARLSPQRLLLLKLLQPYGFAANIVDDLIGSLDKHPGRVFKSTSHTLLLDRGRIIISPDNKKGNIPLSITAGMDKADYNNYKLKIMHNDSPLIIKDNPLAVSVDSALLIYPLMLRQWQQGDWFFPLGMKTRQKLSDFFIHQKVALHYKDEVPILVNGNGEMIWVGGYRLDERYKVSDKTEKVTIFELFK